MRLWLFCACYNRHTHLPGFSPQTTFEVRTCVHAGVCGQVRTPPPSCLDISLKMAVCSFILYTHAHARIYAPASARECGSSDIHCGNMSALGMGMLRRERRWLRGYPEMSALASIHPHFILLTFFFAHAGRLYVTPIARKPGGVLHTYSLVTHFFRPHLLRCPRLMSPFPLSSRRERESPAPSPNPTRPLPCVESSHDLTRHVSVRLCTRGSSS